METATYLLEQAAKCRRLASGADDDHASQILIVLAEEYERLALDPAEEAGPLDRGGAKTLPARN
jgi:hypothetical protein